MQQARNETLDPRALGMASVMRAEQASCLCCEEEVGDSDASSDARCGSDGVFGLSSDRLTSPRLRTEVSRFGATVRSWSKPARW